MRNHPWRRIPDVTDEEAKAAADSIAHVEEVATKADLNLLKADFETALARLESKLTRLIFGVVIGVVSVATAVIIGAVGVMIKLIPST